ncbi:MAG: outer membrane lipoprotein carrier protein LolA [Gemmatimonadetes bacterium]|nr:outer membrane lipoprotein carrier protein LolA [Gemmatimonadota bacterium]
MQRSYIRILSAFMAAGLAACSGSDGEAVRQAEAVQPAKVAVPARRVLPARPLVEAAVRSEKAYPEAPAPALAPESAPVVEPTLPAERETAEEAPAAQASAAAILRRAEAANTAMRSFQADFVQDLSVPLLGSSQRSRGRMYARQPGRFSMRFTAPAGDLVVADGRNLWLYYPSTDKKQVIKTPMAAGGDQVDFQKQFLSNSAARYNAVLNGTESVGGRPANVLTLTPKGQSPFRKVRIWVDTRDALVRRFEITEENESVRRIELSNLRPNATIPDAIFSFTPPAGTQVFQQ